MLSLKLLDLKILKVGNFPPIRRKTRINQRKHKVARKRGMGGIGILGASDPTPGGHNTS